MSAGGGWWLRGGGSGRTPVVVHDEGVEAGLGETLRERGVEGVQAADVGQQQDAAVVGTDHTTGLSPAPTGTSGVRWPGT